MTGFGYRLISDVDEMLDFFQLVIIPLEKSLHTELEGIEIIKPVGSVTYLRFNYIYADKKEVLFGFEFTSIEVVEEENQIIYYSQWRIVMVTHFFLNYTEIRDRKINLIVD